MNRNAVLLVAAVLMVASAPGFAELQNVRVGGEVRVGANYVINWAAKPGPLGPRFAPGALPGRPIGDFFSGMPAGNGGGIVSPFNWNDDNTNTLSFVEQRTKLNVTADFTDEVTAFIELDSYDHWGEDFRSDYLTGVDSRAASGDDVEVYQAYIEARELLGYPLRLRIGRQELSFGSEWLVGPKDFGPFFSGRSFDGIRLTYQADPATIDVFWSKLAEVGALEEDGDTDFYGIYASCVAIEGMTIDAYWLYLRDAAGLRDTGGIRFSATEIIEDIFGLDEYPVTEIHTVGLRAAGAWQALDYSVEAAYQWGDAGTAGFNFKPVTYGDGDAEYDEWALKLDVGYTLDMMWQPRIHAGYSYYGGEDNRDLSFVDWLNPLTRVYPESSVSFNRLFSNNMYNGFFDLQNDLSNAHVFRVGVNTHPRENIDLHVDLGYFLADETFDMPVNLEVGRFLVPILPGLPFLTEESDDDLGFVSDVVLVYHYTENLSFLFHWSHLFAGDALRDGNFVNWNGLMYNGGTGDEDGEYFRFETRLKF